MDDPDYIVVGAGSAGGALVDRLSADGTRKVLLLEAGPGDRHPFVAMPKGIGQILGSARHTWVYQTDAADGIASETWLRGKLLGGSSSVNGMMYFRGQQADYQDWVDAGAIGWGPDEMWRVFQEVEDHQLGEGNGRGTKGPLGISMQENGDPLIEAFIEAGTQMGITRVPDLNNPAQEGVGYSPMSIRNGRRESSARAFLKKARKRANVAIVTGFEADRILFQDRRATGVSGQIEGKPVTYRTSGEIILCAGALNSPAILQRSGVGNPELLANLGIPVVAARPSVGEHLLEHRTLMLNYGLVDRLGENHEYRGWRLLANTLRYALTRKGPMASGPYPAAAFLRTRSDLDRPDAEVIFSPVVTQTTEAGMQTENGASFHVFAFPCRPLSEGTVRIRSSDPSILPAIWPNYLAHPYDQQVTIDCFRFLREWMRQPAIAPLIADERSPLADIESDEDIIRFYKERGASTFHSCGTCRMGSDADSVVDERGQVRGVFGLRVADAAIMPTMPSCNTNGPAIGIGWRMAEIICAGNR